MADIGDPIKRRRVIPLEEEGLPSKAEPIRVPEREKTPEKVQA